MSEHPEPARTQEHAVEDHESFRFEEFGDAASAQAAFEAAYPIGSPIERALQGLRAIGAQGRAMNPTTVACRYVEKDAVLVHHCWHISLACDQEKTIQRARLALGIVAI
jgi:hypothetical protein